MFVLAPIASLTKIFCSVRTSSRTRRQLSGPRLTRRSLKEAPERGRGSSPGWKSAMRSDVESCSRIRGRSGEGKGTSCRKWDTNRSRGMS